MTLRTFSFQRIADSFSYAGYRQLWTGSVIAEGVYRMQDVVFAWQMLQLTHSAFWVGLAAFLWVVPLLIWSLLGGALADTMKRQRLAAGALLISALSAAALGVLTVLGLTLPWHILVTAFLSGSAWALYSPARYGLLPNVVPPEGLLSASTVEYSSTRLAGFFGPVLAGLLLDFWGIPAAITAQVILFSIAALLFLRLRTASDDAPRGARRTESLLAGLGAIRPYLRTDRPLRALFLFALVIVPFGMSYLKLMPVFARDVLGVGASTLGLLSGMFSLGAGAAGLSAAAAGDTFSKGRALWLAALALGVGLMTLSFSRDVFSALVLLLIMGLAGGLYLTMCNVSIQSRPPDRLRGRLVGVWGMVWGVAPFAYLAAGAGAEVWGVAQVMLVCGIVCTLVCVAVEVAGSQLKAL